MSDSLLVSAKQYQQIRKNIADYRVLIDEHKTLQTSYVEIKNQYQSLLKLYTKLDSATNTSEYKSIRALKIEIEKMKIKITENNKTIKKLNTSYQFCRDDLVRFKAKRTLRKLNKYGKNEKN